MALTGERSFHGLAWRVLDDDNYESFYVRPHQVGNPDSIQYNPVFNGVASWQLYHDEGFWAAIDFPIGEWFTIRVVFAGSRAEVFVGDMDDARARGRRAEDAGRGRWRRASRSAGPGCSCRGSRTATWPAPFVGAAPAPAAAVPGIVPAWLGVRRVRGARGAAVATRRRRRCRPHLDAARRGAVRPRQPRDRERHPRRPQHGLGARHDPSAGPQLRRDGPRLQRPRGRLPQRDARCSAARTRTARATTASLAASAGTTRSTCRWPRAQRPRHRRLRGFRRLGHPGPLRPAASDGLRALSRRCLHQPASGSSRDSTPGTRGTAERPSRPRWTVRADAHARSTLERQASAVQSPAEAVSATIRSHPCPR